MKTRYVSDLDGTLLHYAVENAAEELKEIATAVIGCNNDDAVAK